MLARHNGPDLDHGSQSRGLKRLCAATRTVRPVETMIRFVVAPDGEVIVDLKHELPGRGVWVSATRCALERAVKAGALARGFRRPLQLAGGLADRTEHLLENAALDALATARKAGLIVMGFSQVENAVAAHSRVVALLHAAEAASEGVITLDAAVRQSRQAAAVPAIRILTARQLDLALGRPNVIHAALLAGRASDKFMACLRRLERFRAGEPGENFKVAPTRLVRTELGRNG